MYCMAYWEGLFISTYGGDVQLWDLLFITCTIIIPGVFEEKVKLSIKVTLKFISEIILVLEKALFLFWYNS